MVCRATQETKEFGTEVIMANATLSILGEEGVSEGGREGGTEGREGRERGREGGEGVGKEGVGKEGVGRLRERKTKRMRGEGRSREEGREVYRYEGGVHPLSPDEVTVDVDQIQDCRIILTIIPKKKLMDPVSLNILITDVKSSSTHTIISDFQYLNVTVINYVVRKDQIEFSAFTLSVGLQSGHDIGPFTEVSGIHCK